MNSNSYIYITLILLLCSILIIAHDGHDHKHTDNVITCGSSLKLRHKNSNYELHSSNVSWGSGSGELAVTAVQDTTSSPNTLWQFTTKYDTTDEICPYGNIIRCGDTIRLKHVATNTMLRSASHRAPLSGRSEVSAENKGNKNAENFILICINNKIGTPLTQTTSIKLKHHDSGKYLYTQTNSQFNQQNCRGCPIQGHLEVSCHHADDSNAIFTFGDGFYVPVNNERVIYNYTDFSLEPKILFDSKIENNIVTKQTDNTKTKGHDEL